MRMSVNEVMKLARWLEKKGLKDTHEVVIEYTETGIGQVLVAKVKTTDDEGLFIDLSDYENW